MRQGSGGEGGRVPDKRYRWSVSIAFGFRISSKRKSNLVEKNNNLESVMNNNNNKSPHTEYEIGLNMKQ